MDDPVPAPRVESFAYQDLSIVIEQKRRGGYTARVYDGLPEGGNEPVATEELLDLDDPRLKRPKENPAVRVRRPCLDAIEETGDWLYRFLLIGQVREIFLQRVEEVGRDAGKKLRVRLCWNSALSELEDRFWEALRINDWEWKEKRKPSWIPPRIWNPFVWLNAPLSLVRHPLGAVTQPTLSYPGTFRVLILYANPKPKPGDDPQYAEYLPAARQAIHESLKSLEKDGWVNVIPSEAGRWGVTPEEAEKAIAEHNPHILVVLAHGYRATYAQRYGGFYFSDGQGGTAAFEGPRLAKALQGKEVRLVFAPVCHSAALMRVLSTAGVPALLGINQTTPFPDVHDVARLSKVFFTALADDRQPLEECMYRAREALSRNPGIERPEWILPTLYLTAPDGQLFGSEEELVKSTHLQKLENICNYFPTRDFTPDEWSVGKNYIQTTVKEEKEERKGPEVAERMVRTIVERQVEEALQEHGQVAVVADAGIGKSTLLRAQVLKAITAHRTRGGRIPVLVHLNDLTNWKDWEKTHSLEEFLRTQYLSLGHQWGENLLAEKIGAWLSQQYELKKCFFLFDALDEVEQSCRGAVVEALNALDSPFILATRPAGYDSKLRARKVELSAFTEEQIQQYATAYLGTEDEWERFAGALDGHPGTKALAENPLLLSLLCYLFTRGQLKLPASRAELFEQAVEERLKARSPKSEKDDRHRLLEESAFHTFFCDVRKAEISEGILLSLARAVGGKRKGSLLKDEVLQSGLLTKNGPNSYTFLHPRFQEYFAAASLKRRTGEEPNGRRWLFEGGEYTCQICQKVLVPFPHYFWHADWHDTITLLAELLDDATPLLRRIQAERDDVFHQMLTLAACCLGSAKKVEPKVGREIVEAVCQKCRRLVEYPDFNTVRLEVLLKGRQEKWAEWVWTFLSAGLKDKDWRVCEAVAWALWDVKDPRVVPALRKALKDGDFDFFWEAAWAIEGKMKDPRIEMSTVFLLADHDVNLGVRGRRAAARILEEIKNLGVVRTLRKALENKDRRVRLAVTRVLWEIKDPRAVPIWCKALKDGDWKVREVATWALGKIEDPRAVLALCDALRDEVLDVFEAAAAALAEIGDPKAVPHLLAAAAARRYEAYGLWNALWDLSQRARIRIYEDGKWEPLPPVEPSSVKVIAHAVRRGR